MVQTQMISEFVKYRDMLKEEFQTVYDDWQEKMGRLDELSDEERREAVQLFYEWYDLEQNIYEMECQHVEKCLMEALPAILCKLLSEQRAGVRARVDAMYKQYETLRKDGVSFQKAKEKLDLDKIDRYERALSEPALHPNIIAVRPAQCWLPMGDGYVKLKEMGVVEYVRRNYMFMYDNKNNNE